MFTELEKTGGILTDLYVDWKNGDITRDQYRKMKVKFEEREEQLKMQSNTLQMKFRLWEKEFHAIPLICKPVYSLQIFL